MAFGWCVHSTATDWIVAPLPSDTSCWGYDVVYQYVYGIRHLVGSNESRDRKIRGCQRRRYRQLLKSEIHNSERRACPRQSSRCSTDGPSTSGERTQGT